MGVNPGYIQRGVTQLPFPFLLEFGNHKVILFIVVGKDSDLKHCIDKVSTLLRKLSRLNARANGYAYFSISIKTMLRTFDMRVMSLL